MSEKSPTLRRPSTRVLASVSGIALAAFLSGCAGDKDNEEFCTSPLAVSSPYPGDKAAQPGDKETWKTGVLVTTSLHPEATGLVVSYRHPNSAQWTDTSQPVAPDLAGEVALRIGNGDVVFGTATVARLGSAACTSPPDSRFGNPRPIDDLLQQGAAVPEWR
jgi:hypothetical protein